MKNILKLGLIGALLLSGCASQNLANNSGQNGASLGSTVTNAPIHSPDVAKRLNECIFKSNQNANAKLVDSQVIVVTKNNPHAKALFNSTDKLTDEQARALENYLVEANACRPIALEGVSPEMVNVYEDFFKKIDKLYADLIARKITIGVANQERYLLIDEAHMKRLALQSKKN